MICRADKHYRVIRQNGHGEVVRLACMQCVFEVDRHSFPVPRGSKSGQGRYNLMRARMVKHIHADHLSAPKKEPS